MKSTKVIMILTLFLTVKTTVGQRKVSINCQCYSATASHQSCHSSGCSRGSNPNCTGTSSPDGGDVIFYLTDTDGYLGCNCPEYYPVAILNGFYGIRDGSIRDGRIRRRDGNSITGRGYSYATCTDFGGNGRNSQNHSPDNANDATDCCNYCCNRNDSRPNGLSGGAIAAIVIAVIVVVVGIAGAVWWWRRRNGYLNKF